jgi:hypothetical protein
MVKNLIRATMSTHTLMVAVAVLAFAADHYIDSMMDDDPKGEGGREGYLIRLHDSLRGWCHKFYYGPLCLLIAYEMQPTKSPHRNEGT